MLIITNLVIIPVACGLMLWTLWEFIPGARPWSPWQRAAAWTLSLLSSACVAATFWLPDVGLGAVLRRAGNPVSMGVVIAMLVAVTRGYLRSDPLGRRQTKWVVYGCYVGLLPFGVFWAVLWLGILPEWTGMLWSVALIAAVAIPLGFLVAIAFYQFLDIDRLFSATLSYSVLAILGIAIVLSVIPTAARAGSAALGLEPATG